VGNAERNGHFVSSISHPCLVIPDFARGKISGTQRREIGTCPGVPEKRLRAFRDDIGAGYVELIMSQVHAPVTGGVDEVSRIRGLIYEHILEPGFE
jgi:hypothetical protein